MSSVTVSLGHTVVCEPCGKPTPSPKPHPWKADLKVCASCRIRLAGYSAQKRELEDYRILRRQLEAELKDAGRRGDAVAKRRVRLALEDADRHLDLLVS